MNHLILPQTRMTLIARLQGAEAHEPEELVNQDQDRNDLIRLYWPVVLHWCLKSGLQLADAEDLTQEITMKLFDKIHRFDRTKGQFRCWLRTVVRHAVVDSIRQGERRPHLVGDSRLQSLQAPTSLTALEESLDPAGNAEAQLANQIVKRVRKRVHDRTWGVYERNKMFGKALAELAQELSRELNENITVGQLRAAVCRVGKMLREERDQLLDAHQQ
jgi:RNA polymerase sigma factor (sigma-70 family)